MVWSGERVGGAAGSSDKINKMAREVPRRKIGVRMSLAHQLLFAGQRLQQRFQPREDYFGLLVFQPELKHALRGELGVLLALNEAGEAFGVDGGFLGEADADGIAAALDLRHAQPLRV